MREERSNGWRRQLQKHTSYRRAALISARYRCSKGETDSCQSDRTRQTHHTVFNNMVNWTLLVSEIFRNVCWTAAERKKSPIFEPMKRKKPPHTSEEHFLEMTELSTYGPGWEMTFCCRGALKKPDWWRDKCLLKHLNKTETSWSVWTCSKQGASIKKINRKDRYCEKSPSS